MRPPAEIKRIAAGLRMPAHDRMTRAGRVANVFLAGKSGTQLAARRVTQIVLERLAANKQHEMIEKCALHGGKLGVVERFHVAAIDARGERRRHRRDGDSGSAYGV